ncbi:hypothetical protein GEMRC1_002483 [Eukaryota sp. GEM-RC1]
MDLQGFESALTSYLFGQSSGLVENLPIPVKASVNTLKRNQEEIDEEMVKFRHQLAELMAKHEQNLDPIFRKRAEIISGQVEPSEADWEAARAEGGVEEVSDEETEETTAGVPSFWTIVLRNTPLVSNLIEDDDVPALDALKDVRYHSLTDGDIGFSLEFVFGDNPLFSECTLTKTLFMSDKEDDVLDHIEACAEIPWKEGKSSILEKDTFFKFFTDIPNPDEVTKQTQEEMEMQYETAHIIKSTIEKAVSAFLGESSQFAYDFEDDESEDEEYVEECDEDSSGDEEQGGQQCANQ